MLSEWTCSKLELIRHRDRILVRDSLRMLPPTDNGIHNFARQNGFTVIVASTNLAFRDLFEATSSDAAVRKLLIVDRAPRRLRRDTGLIQSPPPFYPDLTETLADDARLDLDLRQFLIDQTGDPSWPSEVNDRKYVRLIVEHLDAVLLAHKNLRAAGPDRFNDYDLATIVAFAALGVPELAFKTLSADEYWQIGLRGHGVLEELNEVVPEITKSILDKLASAPAPFNHFANHDPETVLRGIYLSLILSQHYDHWELLLGKVDPELASLGKIKVEKLREAATKTIKRDPQQADQDIESVEHALSKDALQTLLLEYRKLNEPDEIASLIRAEKYSTMFRSLALLMALDDLLSPSPSKMHSEIASRIFGADVDKESIIEKRQPEYWQELKEAYRISRELLELQAKLASEIRTLGVMPPADITFNYFHKLWHDGKANRLEYLADCLERLVNSGHLLPRHDDELPSAFVNAAASIRTQAQKLSEKIHAQLDDLNRAFQAFTARDYASWTKADAPVVLTSRFLSRCVKPHWDPQTENAAIFILDGMRYDIWDELVKPVFEDRMDVLQEYQASSLLPSETYYTRKAISAGTLPESFDLKAGEDKLLQEGLKRELGLTVEVKTVAPDTTGMGETVRYQAGNLDVYIFELCDKSLHNIRMRNLPDGRQVPARHLSYIYQQMLKDVIDTEVSAIVRKLAPGTKVFVVSDHGFCRVARNPLRLEIGILNEPIDCNYRYARLRETLDAAGIHGKIKQNVWEFANDQLHLPATDTGRDRNSGSTWEKRYASAIFPKVGYSLGRPGHQFDPDAYTHGGISIEELMIPMLALRVRERDEGLLYVGDITGPTEVVEGQEAEFTLTVKRGAQRKGAQAEIKIEAQASFTDDPEKHPLERKIAYVSAKGQEIAYRFKPDVDATEKERIEGRMERTLTVTIAYQDGSRSVRKSRSYAFSVRLNSEKIVRRVPSNLGNILGLTPKSMR